MVHHEGYVFITPRGTFVRRVEFDDGGIAFVNSTTLDGATLFPSDKAPSESSKQDWTLIKDGRSSLRAMAARTTQTVRLAL